MQPVITRTWSDSLLVVAVSATAAIAGVQVLGETPTLLLAAATMLGFVLLAQLSLKWALILGLPTIVLWVRLGTAARPILPAPTDALFVVLAGILIVQAAARRQPVAWLPTDVFFAGLLLCALLSLPQSSRFTSFLFAFKTEVLAYVAFRTTIAVLDDRRDITRVFVALLIVQIAMMAMFAYSYAIAYEAGGAAAVVYDRGGSGATGGIGTPWAKANGFAAHVALLLPPIVALAAMPGRRLRRSLAVITALASLAVLLMSASRGATLAAMLGALPFLWVYRRRPLAVFGTLGAAAVCVVVVIVSNPAMSLTTGRFSRLGDDESSIVRRAAWQAHLDAIVDQPLIGHGLDNVGLPFSVSFQRGELDAHNFLLKTAYQTGLAGLAFRLAMLGYFGLVLWRTREASARDPALYAAFGACYLTAIANGMVESVFSGERYNLLFMLIMGLLIVWAQHREPDIR